MTLYRVEWRDRSTGNWRWTPTALEFMTDAVLLTLTPAFAPYDTRVVPFNGGGR